MSEREKLIVRIALDFLHRHDIQAAEVVIHAHLNMQVRPRPTLNEMEGALAFMESKRWVTGARSDLGDTRWVITTAGKAALADL